MSTQLVWFKRDLRIHDHAALRAACLAGPVACVYIVEPGYWQGEDTSQRQYDFLRECLRDLYRALKSQHLTLHVLCGEVPQVLERLHQQLAFTTLHAHQETGNALTFARDQAVARWCQHRGVTWHEHLQHGVFRRLASRDTWHSQWQALMQAEQIAPPPAQDAPWPWPPEAWPDWRGWGKTAADTPLRQSGGRQEALKTLSSFLTHRSASYRGGISSPLRASEACSRLSPYLSLGCLSLRETVQATQARMQDANIPTWQRQGLAAFMSRLHWHSHFIQKLESEPAIEWRNMHRGYDGLREADWNPEHFERLRTGRTGWPLVDACVAMLAQTGWLNFRMRAMLVSVASYPLWLHWREVGQWLAQQFTDYEPGIHWSQMQMQAGTTGINTTRVYNPIKQAKDQDPTGVFVRHWLPVLQRVPDAWLFEPWKMPANVQAQCGVHIGADWPRPVVDLEQATRQAKARLHALRQTASVRAAKAGIVDKHGSRTAPRAERKSRKSADAGALAQFTLDL